MCICGLVCMYVCVALSVQCPQRLQNKIEFPETEFANGYVPSLGYWGCTECPPEEYVVPLTGDHISRPCRQYTFYNSFNKVQTLLISSDFHISVTFILMRAVAILSNIFSVNSINHGSCVFLQFYPLFMCLIIPCVVNFASCLVNLIHIYPFTYLEFQC